MLIENEIDIDLWKVIQKNYESDNFRGAIVDAIFQLTNTIRNKTGLEGDGSNLIGQAFGGDDPRIKLNKLQTDSEKDIQQGMLNILKGIYTGIRNPRSHDVIVDDKASADAIILFINYLLKLIDQSKLRFCEEDFLKRVFDKFYVIDDYKYSELLVKDIPERQRANIAIQVILQRHRGNIYALGHFLQALVDQLKSAELSRLYSVVSDELKLATDEEDIRYLIHICPGKHWSQIEPAVKIRIESILFKDFSDGRHSLEENRTQGALATWVTKDHLKNFDDLTKWTFQTISMEKSEDEEVIAYIEKFFWDKICYANYENITWPLKSYFKTGLKKHDPKIIEQLEKKITLQKDHPWWEVFKEELKEYPEIKYEEFAF